MIAARHRRHDCVVLLMIVLSVLAVLAANGCAVVRATKGDPGLDISPVKPGAPREAVEARMGLPLRGWTTSEGIAYRLYRYDAGVPPSAGDALGHAILDAISVGAWEIAMAFDPNKGLLPARRRYRVLAVSYDTGGAVIGVFPNVGEFAVLPEDGRPLTRRDAPRGKLP